MYYDADSSQIVMSIAANTENLDGLDLITLEAKAVVGNIK